MFALLIILILIIVLSMINIICQIVNIIDCSKSEKVTVVKIKYKDKD